MSYHKRNQKVSIFNLRNIPFLIFETKETKPNQDEIIRIIIESIFIVRPTSVMASFIFFLVASLSTITAKPLLGSGAGDDYNSLLNGGSPVLVGDVGSNNNLAKPLPVLPVPGARPFKINTASSGLKNPYGGTYFTEPNQIPSVPEVKPVEIGTTGDPNGLFNEITNGNPSSSFDVGRISTDDTPFVASGRGGFISFENNERMTLSVDLDPFPSPGNNPCDSHGDDLGCCDGTYEDVIRYQGTSWFDFSCARCKFLPSSLQLCCAVLICSNS